MNSLFARLLCGAALDRQDGVYRCLAGHSCDIAKEDYAYLPPDRRSSFDIHIFQRESR